MTNPLEQLTQHTTVVADTGDINSIQRLRPVDATTNPSLILKAASDSAYSHILDEGVALAKNYQAANSFKPQWNLLLLALG